MLQPASKCNLRSIVVFAVAAMFGAGAYGAPEGRCPSGGQRAYEVA